MPDRNKNAPVIRRGVAIQAYEAADIFYSPALRARITLTPTAERLISEWAVALQTGELEFGQLPDSLREFWVYAYEDGRASAVCLQCARQCWERDLWYFVANNPGKRPRDFYSHATSQLWAEATL